LTRFPEGGKSPLNATLLEAVTASVFSADSLELIPVGAGFDEGYYGLLPEGVEVPRFMTEVGHPRIQMRKACSCPLISGC
jgi:hypothetical protein